MSKWFKKSTNIIWTTKLEELLTILLKCTSFPCPPLHTIKKYKLYAFKMFCLLKELEEQTRSSNRYLYVAELITAVHTTLLACPLPLRLRIAKARS